VELRYAPHARRRMQQRKVEPRQVETVLQERTITYPAPLLPGSLYHSVVYRADVDGRPLKVYVEEGSDPPHVLSVAWADEED